MKTGGAIVVRLVLILVMGLLAGVAAWGQAGSTVQSLTAGESAESLGGYDSLDSLDFGDGEVWPGFLQAQKVITLSAEVDGVLTAIKYQPQEFIRQGDTAAQIDPGLVELNIESIRTELEMNTALAEAAVSLAYATDNLGIIEKLYNTQIDGSRVGSEKEYREAKQRQEMAELALRKAEKEMELLEISLRQNKLMLKKHQLIAPVSGVVIPLSTDGLGMEERKEVSAGETVVRGQPVLALMKVDFLRVSEPRHLSELDSIKLGQQARVYVEGVDAAVAGTVVFKSPMVASTGQFNIEVEFANPQVQTDGSIQAYRYRFRPGMPARVELLWDDEDGGSQ